MDRHVLLTSLGLTLVLGACGASGGAGTDGGPVAPTDARGDAAARTDAAPPGDGSTTPEAGPMPGAPRFAGLVAVRATSPSEVVLTWLAAADDTTPRDQLDYELYSASSTTAAEALARAGTAPDRVVRGETTATVTGLSAQTLYAFAVVARDAEGARSDVPRARAITTLSTPLVFGAPVKDLAALGLTVTAVSLDHFEVSGPGAAQLAEGDIILADNPFGRALRRITRTTPSGTGFTIVAERAALTDVLRSGTLRSSGAVVDPTGFETGGTALGARYADPRGGVTLAQRQQHRVSLSPPRRTATGGEAELEEGVSLDYAFTWEAGYESEIVLRDDGTPLPESMYAIFTGKLGIEGQAAYQLMRGAEYEVERELLSRTLTLRYLVGNLPVWQTVTVKLMAKLELAAEGELSAKLDVKAEKELRVGLGWSRTTGFYPFRGDGFTQETTFELESEATAKGVLRIYPVISTTLYGVATAAVTVDPSIELDAHARFIPLPVELDKCDVDFSVGLQLSADLTILGQELTKWESDRYELFKVPVFSLPELKLRAPRQADTCHPAKLSLLVSDGYNNRVRDSTIEWTVSDGSATITPPSGTRRPDLTATSAGTKTIRVTAYGDGPLGVVGRRSAEVTVEVEQPAQDCSMVPPPTGGSSPIGCTSLESGFTGIPYFTKTRVAHRSDDDATLIIPTRVVRLQWLSVIPQRDIGQPFWDPPQSTVSTPRREEGPFDGDWDTRVRPSFFGSPGRYSASFTMANGEFGCSFTRPTGMREECQAWGASPLLPDYSTIEGYLVTADDRDVCKGQTGVAIPWVEVVGPGPDDDDDDDPAHAQVFAHGVRSRGQLPSGDRDFVRYPAGGAGGDVYDRVRPREGCAVVVRAEGTPPVRIRVYEGEANAGRDGPVVIEGQTQVRFEPNPASVYFARFDRPRAEEAGDYVAEIDSDCTAATAFPLLAGPITASATVAVHRQALTFRVPVNALTRSVRLTLAEAMPGSSWTAGNAAVDVPMGATEVLVPLEVWNGGFPPGTYVVRVELGDATLFESQTLLSTYDRDLAVSATDYALRQQNFIAMTDARSDSRIPRVELRVGPR
jgi:hypothetical protein